MSKYRKVSIQIWNDEKFRGFTSEQKLLFIFLLTHPHMTSVGGMRASKAGLGAELGWNPQTLSKGFAGPEKHGMVWFDEEASCLILPNFIKHNPPENPNVVKGWAGALDLIPQCPIKSQLFHVLKGYTEGYTEPFIAAFETVSKAYLCRQETSFRNMEQEQEQELKMELELEPELKPELPAVVCGKFFNVKLSLSEVEKLTAKFGEQGRLERIEALSEYIASKGIKYSSHYATILTWDRKNGNGNGKRESGEELKTRKTAEASERVLARARALEQDRGGGAGGAERGDTVGLFGGAIEISASSA